METASPPAQEQLAQLLRLCATSEPAVPRGKTKLQRGGKQNTVSAMEIEEKPLSERTYFDKIVSGADSVEAGLSSVLKNMKEACLVGWDVQQLGQGVEASKDCLTVWKNCSGFGGAVGAQLYSSENPKENQKIIVWAGGNFATNRPGTVRVHGEKMRNQPQYTTGDIVGVTVDLNKGDLWFFLNGIQVIEWRGVLQGPVYPFCSIKHPNGPAATLLQYWKDEAGVNVRESDMANMLSFRDVVGGSQVASLPDVNGSLLEGGGQVLRISLGFCALLQRPLRVHSIRAGRPNPGLGHQHSTGAKLVTDLCGGMARPEVIQYGGHAEGVTELQVWPGVEGLRGGEFIADPHTAGSITLLLQASLPCCLLGQRTDAVLLKLRGGTNTKGAPSTDFMKLCLFPVLTTFFGVPEENLQVTIKKRGYYPLGGGEVDFKIIPVRSLTPITLLERGLPKKITISAFGGGTGKKLSKDVARLVKQKVSEIFPAVDIVMMVSEEPDGGEEKKLETRLAISTTTTTSSGKGQYGGKPNNKNAGRSDDNATMTFKERRAAAEEKRRKNAGVSGCQVVLQTTTGAFITGDSLVLEAGKTGAVQISATEVSDKAVERLKEAWEKGRGCVDEYLMDQLIIFMALAKGTSKVLCPAPTSISSLHIETAIHFSELLCGVKFRVEDQGDGTKIIECEGMGFGLQPKY